MEQILASSPFLAALALGLAGYMFIRHLRARVHLHHLTLQNAFEMARGDARAENSQDFECAIETIRQIGRKDEIEAANRVQSRVLCLIGILMAFAAAIVCVLLKS